jgi:hypothetical protein
MNEAPIKNKIKSIIRQQSDAGDLPYFSNVFITVFLFGIHSSSYYSQLYHLSRGSPTCVWFYISLGESGSN